MVDPSSSVHDLIKHLFPGDGPGLSTRVGLRFSASKITGFVRKSLRSTSFGLGHMGLRVLNSFDGRFSCRFHRSFGGCDGPRSLSGLSSSVRCTLIG